VQVKTQSAILPAKQKWEMTTRTKIITVLVVPLIAALTAQAAAASEHHTRTKYRDRAAATERLLNSNAYAAPSDIAVRPDSSSYSEGAMTSGIAGH
jgi:hypothetical protein